RHRVDGDAPAEPLAESVGDDHPTASRTASRSGAERRRSVRKRGCRILTQAGTMTSPPNVLNSMSSARRSPISAWNLSAENHQKIVPATIVVAVKMIALPVVAVA